MCTQTENHCTHCGLVDTPMLISTCPAACIHENTLWHRRVRVYLQRCRHCLSNAATRTPVAEIVNTLAGTVASTSEEEVHGGGHANEEQQVLVVLRTVEESVWRPTWYHGRGVLRPEMRWRCLVSGACTTSGMGHRSSWSRISKLKCLEASPRRTPAHARERARNAKEIELQFQRVQLVDKRVVQVRC